MVQLHISKDPFNQPAFIFDRSSSFLTHEMFLSFAEPMEGEGRTGMKKVPTSSSRNNLDSMIIKEMKIN